jgi:hypothetical protein
MKNVQAVRYQALPLRLDFFPPPARLTLDPSRRPFIQLIAPPRNTQRTHPKHKSFIECDCACK